MVSVDLYKGILRVADVGNTGLVCLYIKQKYIYVFTAALNNHVL